MNKKTIIKIVFIFFALILVSLTTFFILEKINKGKTETENTNPVIAVINGENIYQSKIQNRLDMITKGWPIKMEDIPEDIFQAIILESYVNNKIEKEAIKENYDKDPVILELLEMYKNNIIRDKYLEDKVYSKITEEKILEEYNKLVNEVKGKEERKIKHILVESEDEINRIRRNILRSGKFEKTAKEKSIDKASAENGGDLGYILKEELVPEFGDIAFMLKVGEISKPVKTQYGWHIIKVEDIRDAKLLNFEEVKENIKENLKNQAVQEFLSTITKDINIELKIKLNKNTENIEEDKIENNNQ